MMCKDCNVKTKVVETRMYHDPNEDFDYVQRRHRCTECNEAFNTIEVTVDVWEEQTNDS